MIKTKFFIGLHSNKELEEFCKNNYIKKRNIIALLPQGENYSFLLVYND